MRARRLIEAVLWLIVLTGLPASALELHSAELSVPGQARSKTVALPDTWPASPSALSGHAEYRLQFELPTAPQALWALRIDRLASVHRLFLNGRLIHEQGEDADGRVRLRLLPAYLTLAPSLLQAGRNELRLQLRFGARAGLSTVQIGPDDSLQQAYLRHRWLYTTLPQSLNIGGAVLAACMLLLWWRRRQERATGLFGALWLIGSLRNYDYFVALSPLPAASSDWFYFFAQASTASLLGLFAMALSGRPWPGLQRVYLACLLLLPLLGLMATGLGFFAELRLAVYPLLIGLGLGAVAVLWQPLRRQRGVALALLWSGVALLVAAGAHDYAYLHGWRPVTEFFWMPYAVPFALACYAAMLLNRLVLGLARAEDLSQRLEQRVAERTAELAEANEAKTRFLAAASHDLRQPVAAIGLLVGLAREQVQALSPAAAMLAKVDQAVAALESLLRGLLDLSRLDAGTAAPALQAVALQPLFDAIALHEQPNAQARGLRLRFHPTAAVALSDPLLLEQMLRNLVANALRYTARGGVLVGARRQERHGHSGLRLQVWDSGCGIAPEHQQQIFGEFVQLTNPERDRHKGLGLGLAIVRRSALLLGHALGLRSRPGRGSCFWIDLPAAATDAAPTAPASPEPQPLALRRIWLLEDDTVLREALAERLQLWGAEVRALGTLAEFGEALAAAPRPDILLSDHRLPDGQGHQAVQRLRERHGPLPVLVISGDSAPQELAVYADGGVPVLHKPLRAEALLPLLMERLSKVCPPGRSSGPGWRPSPPPGCAS